MTPDIKEELRTVNRQLARVEKTVEGEKWRPLIVGALVAVITVSATIIGTCVTNRKQEEVKRDLAQSVQRLSEMGNQVAQKQMTFYTQANLLLTEMDDSFNEMCYLSPTQSAEKRLSDSLDQFRKLLAQVTDEIVAEPEHKALKQYSEFVASRIRLMKSHMPKVSDHEKQKYYNESRAALIAARKALNKIIATTPQAALEPAPENKRLSVEDRGRRI